MSDPALIDLSDFSFAEKEAEGDKSSLQQPGLDSDGASTLSFSDMSSEINTIGSQHHTDSDDEDSPPQQQQPPTSPFSNTTDFGTTHKANQPPQVTSPVQPKPSPAPSPAPAPSGPVRLPPGWQAIPTPDGKTLYLNAATGQTSYEPPVLELPPGWTKIPTPDGKTLYFNAAKGLSTFEHPALGEPAPSTSTPAPQTPTQQPSNPQLQKTPSSQLRQQPPPPQPVYTPPPKQQQQQPTQQQQPPVQQNTQPKLQPVEQEPKVFQATPDPHATLESVPVQGGISKKKGLLEKQENGWLGEYWGPKWVVLKNGRIAYFAKKGDPNPEGFVYLIECDIQVSKEKWLFQLIHERLNVNWTFRCPGSADHSQWVASLASTIKQCKESDTSKATIMEMVLLLGCTKHRTVELYRSFNFYTSKPSTGYYAVSAAIITELLLRKVVDITEKQEMVVISEPPNVTGVGILDDATELLRKKIRLHKHYKLIDYLRYMAGEYAWGEISLQQPVLRCIDLAVLRGHLMRKGKKDWLVANYDLEAKLITQMNDFSQQYSKDDAREHATLGIAYTMLRVSHFCSSEYPTAQDALDIKKIYPKLRSNADLQPVLTKMIKCLGAFDKKRVWILGALYTATISYLTGNAEVLAAAKKVAATIKK